MEILTYNSNFSHVESTLFFGQLMDKDIELSIIIPTYNRLDALQVAIKSALNQDSHSILKYEIIVVDNNPESINNKDIPTIIKDWQLRNFRYFVNNENIGMKANWNRGIELSYGKWIIVLHDDDYFLPNFIETSYKDINRFQKNDAIVHYTSFHDKRKNKEPDYFDIKKSVFLKLNSLHVVNGNFHVSAALVRRNVMFDIGGFNPELYPISDYDFTQKLVKKYNVVAIDNYPLVIIIFEENETLNPRVFDNWFLIAKEIKKNAVSDFNKLEIWLFEKIIDEQINKDISLIANQIIIDKNDQITLFDKLSKTDFFTKIIWRIFNISLRVYNFLIEKRY